MDSRTFYGKLGVQPTQIGKKTQKKNRAGNKKMNDVIISHPRASFSGDLSGV
jgi:hypothetical protein